MLLAAHVAVGVGAAVTRSVRLLADDLPFLGEDPLAARRRVFGEWAAAVERIRRTIPEDGAYVLVDAQPVEQGAHFWVRHDLAPRRALFLGRMEELPRPRRLRGAIPRRLRWAVVVTGADRPPRLLAVSELLAEAAERPAEARRRGTGAAPDLKTGGGESGEAGMGDRPSARTSRGQVGISPGTSSPAGVRLP